MLLNSPQSALMPASKGQQTNMLKNKLSLKSLSGILSPGRERREPETNGKTQPMKATHFDYISNREGSLDRPRAQPQHHSQSPIYPRVKSNRPPTRDERGRRDSSEEYQNGSSKMHHTRLDGYKRHKREEDEEMIYNQVHKYDNRGPKRSSSFQDRYPSDRGHHGKGSFQDHYPNDRVYQRKGSFQDVYPEDRGQPRKGSFQEQYSDDRHQQRKGSFQEYYPNDSGQQKRGSFQDHYNNDRSQHRKGSFQEQYLDDRHQLRRGSFQDQYADDRGPQRKGSFQDQYPNDRSQQRKGSLTGQYRESRSQSRGGSLPGHYRQESPPPSPTKGPPKPPRRQQSLNRIHIPDDPDTDFTSPSDYDVHSPSSGSNSPKNWKMSPLVDQRSLSQNRHERPRSPDRARPRSPDRNRPRSPNQNRARSLDRERPKSPIKDHSNSYYRETRPVDVQPQSHDLHQRSHEMEYQWRYPGSFTNTNYQPDFNNRATQDPYQYTGTRRPASFHEDRKPDRYQKYRQNENYLDQSGMMQNEAETTGHVWSTSNARPLVVFPQKEKIPEGPRPIYRSDGEIDLREPSRQDVLPKEPLERVSFRPKPASVPNRSHPPHRRHTTDFNYYPDLYRGDEPATEWWEEPKQTMFEQPEETQAKTQNALRTVRGVKAYDQHLKKYRRPTNLGDVAITQPHTRPQLTPQSSTDYPVSDDGQYPTVERPRNLKVGVRQTPRQHLFTDAYNDPPHEIYNGNQQATNLYNGSQNQSSLYNGQVHDDNSYNAFHPYESRQHMPETHSQRSSNNQEVVTVRSPLPSDTENVNSVKQVNSGKQTIFCLVSQVVPTSPSPEESPGPIVRELVDIEDGKVSPVMKQPIISTSPTQDRYRQSPVHNGRKFIHSTSQDSSTGNEYDFKRGSDPVTNGYYQHGMTKSHSQKRQKEESQRWNYSESAYRANKTPSGYQSNPELERRKGKQSTHHSDGSMYDKQRSSAKESEFVDVDMKGDVDTAPTVPVKDLIKRISQNPLTPVLPVDKNFYVMAEKRYSADGNKISQRESDYNEHTANEIVKATSYERPHPDKYEREETVTRKHVPSPEKLATAVYYNQDYITPPLSQAAKEPSHKVKRKAVPQTFAELPIKAVESRDAFRAPVQESDEDRKEPIDARRRTAFFESLTPLTKEEEIQSVPRKSDQPKTIDLKKLELARKKAYYNSLVQSVEQDEMQRVITEQPTQAARTQDALIRRSREKDETIEYDHLSKPSPRQAYYERLRQRGQVQGSSSHGMLGRRSQSLPKLDTESNEPTLADSKSSSKSIEELLSIEASRKQLSVGALLFQRKKLEVEEQAKKQATLEKIRMELELRRSGSAPNNKQSSINDEEEDDAAPDAIDILEKRKHPVLTHIAGKKVRGRDSADFEQALNDLENIHDAADQEADEILHPRYYRPYDHRAAEIPMLAQKVAELQEILGVHAAAGSGKQRRRGKRSKSDLSQMSNAFYANDEEGLEAMQGSIRVNQDFNPYRQASHPKTVATNEEVMPADHESTSDEDKTPRPKPAGTNSKLYRPPRSTDNLGFSSDSSASPERPVRVTPKLVLPEHVRNESPVCSDASVSSHRQQRKAAREAFFSGEEVGKHGSQSPSKSKMRASEPEVKAQKSGRTHLAPPAKQSVKQASKTTKTLQGKPPPAPALTKLKESQDLLQPPGCRDSVSTIDSTTLAQPFEDMDDEYHSMVKDHSADLMPPAESDRMRDGSSVESLMQMAAEETVDKDQLEVTTRNAPYSPIADIPLADEETFSLSSHDEAEKGEGKQCLMPEETEL